MSALRKDRSRLALACAALGALVIAGLTVAFLTRESVHTTVEPRTAAGAPGSGRLQAPELEERAERTDALDRVSSDGPAPGRGSSAAALRVHVDARIVGANGEPLSGARMEPRDLPGVVAATSDSDGRIDWTIEFAADSKAAKQGVAGALVSCAGYASKVCIVMLLPDPDCHLGEIRLQPGASIIGFVRDRGGRAVPDAAFHSALLAPTVERGQPPLVQYARPIEYARTRSASDGSFKLDGLPLGTILLFVDAKRMTETSVPPIELARAGEIAEVQIALDDLAPDEWIEGKVLDPHDRPFAGAKLRVNFPGMRAGSEGSEVSDADGAVYFETGKLKPDQLVSAVDPSGRFDPSEERHIEPGAHDVEFRLREPRYFRARLVNEQREAVPWGWIDLNAEGIQWRAPGYWESTDRSGVARMRVPHEKFGVQVFAQGYRTQRFGPIDPKDVGDELEFALTSGQSVRGRVIARGFGVPGAEVLLCPSFAPDRATVSSDATIGGRPFDVLASARPSNQGTTDTQGRFALSVERAGWYVLRASYQKRGFASVGPVKLESEGVNADIELELREPGELRGKVLVAPGRTPDGIVVGVSNGAGFANVRTVGPDGAFRFDALAPGAWQVRHCRAGLAPTEPLATSRGIGSALEQIAPDVVIEAGGTAEVVLDLVNENQCALVGRFEMTGLVPSIWQAGVFEEHSPAWERWPALATSQIDAQGAFRIEVTTPGRYRLRLQTRHIVVYDFVDLRPGETRWDCAIVCGSLRAEGLPPIAEFVKLQRDLVYQWRGTGALRVLQRLEFVADGVAEIAHVPEGPGRIDWIKSLEEFTADMQSTPVMDTLVRAGEECRVTLPQMR